MNGIVGFSTTLPQNADAVYDGVYIVYQVAPVFGIGESLEPDLTLLGVRCSGMRGRSYAQRARKSGADYHARTCMKERRNGIPADKAGTAKYKYRFLLPCHRAVRTRHVG